MSAHPYLSILVTLIFLGLVLAFSVAFAPADNSDEEDDR